MTKIEGFNRKPIIHVDECVKGSNMKRMRLLAGVVLAAILLGTAGCIIIIAPNGGGPEFREIGREAPALKPVREAPRPRHVLKLVGGAPTIQAAIKVLADEHHAYVSEWMQGPAGIIDYTGKLEIFDISKPKAPVAIGQLHLPDAGRGMSKAGDLLYVATAWRGVTVVDVKDKANPRIVSQIDTPCIALDVWVDGPILYIADAMDGMLVYNISAPTDPLRLGGFPTLHQANGLWKVGNLMYLTDLNAFYILDVTNPAKPVQLGRLDYNGNYTDWFRSLTVDGDYAYTASSFNGLKVIDVRDPGSPRVVGTCKTDGGEAFHVAKRGACVYLAAASGGVCMISVAHPTAPAMAATTYKSSEPGRAYGLDVVGPYVYVADMLGGFQILK